MATLEKSVRIETSKVYFLDEASVAEMVTKYLAEKFGEKRIISQYDIDGIRELTVTVVETTYEEPVE